MARLISEKSFINENIIKAEDRFNSQYARFLDKTPVFVTYYNINNIESVVDLGFQNVEQVIGENSPIKFNRIDDFPVYGLDPILLDLNDDDEGLTTSFESELVILPNTITPKPNDYFVINHLGKGFLFSVTTVDFDTIKSNNYYKIGFSIKTISDDATSNIEKQTTDEYSCIFNNVGTNEKCIVQSTEYNKLQMYSEFYNKLTDTYKILFYNEKTNTFLFTNGVFKIYDKYLNFFINRNELFTQKYSYDTTFLTPEDNSHDMLYKYEKSIYRNIEKLSSDIPDSIHYSLNMISDPFSVFILQCIKNVRSIEFCDSIGEGEYISSDIIAVIKNTGTIPIPEDIGYNKILFIKYMSKEIKDLFDIDIDMIDSDYKFEPSFTNYLMMPIIMYIIRILYTKRMSIN